MIECNRKAGDNMNFKYNQTELGEILGLKQCSISQKIKKCNWKLTEMALLMQAGAIEESEVMEWLRTYKKH